MAKRKKIFVELDSGDISHLRDEDIIAMLRAAECVIGKSGRNMLVKILKGSKDKKVLELGHDTCLTYGYFNHLTMSEISHRVDYLILEKYLYFEHDFTGMPLLYYTDKGWEIEHVTYAHEIVEKIKNLEPKDYQDYALTLKDRNRKMILKVIDIIQATSDEAFIPFLKVWKTVAYQKVKKEINKTINLIIEGS